jgi:hypothetical protein
MCRTPFGSVQELLCASHDNNYFLTEESGKLRLSGMIAQWLIGPEQRQKIPTIAEKRVSL